MEKTDRFSLPFRLKLSLIIISVCGGLAAAAIGAFYSMEVYRSTTRATVVWKPPMRC